MTDAADIRWTEVGPWTVNYQTATWSVQRSDGSIEPVDVVVEDDGHGHTTVTFVGQYPVNAGETLMICSWVST